jgi:hypothetical protein
MDVVDAQAPKTLWDPTSFNCATSGGSSQRSAMAAVNALNAGKSLSGLLPSVVSCETMCTKLTPSSSLKEA